MVGFSFVRETNAGAGRAASPPPQGQLGSVLKMTLSDLDAELLKFCSVQQESAVGQNEPLRLQSNWVDSRDHLPPSPACLKTHTYVFGLHRGHLITSFTMELISCNKTAPNDSFLHSFCKSK